MKFKSIIISVFATLVVTSPVMAQYKVTGLKLYKNLAGDRKLFVKVYDHKSNTHDKCIASLSDDDSKYEQTDCFLEKLKYLIDINIAVQKTTSTYNKYRYDISFNINNEPTTPKNISLGCTFVSSVYQGLEEVNWEYPIKKYTSSYEALR